MTLNLPFCSDDKQVEHNMLDRRTETRMLCADLVHLEWKDKAGRTKKVLANLEDISGRGACLQIDLPLPPQTVVKISLPKNELIGKVRYCIYREIGYFLGIEFESGFRWTESEFKPQHLLDPRTLSNAPRALPSKNQFPGQGQ
ncbi:MAG: PilZ domain-containing protein [Acidobacteriota bacterium]|nr:PilZ domain-containing protein [Acidobacteriota bacterium]